MRWDLLNEFWPLSSTHRDKTKRGVRIIMNIHKGIYLTPCLSPAMAWSRFADFLHPHLPVTFGKEFHMSTTCMKKHFLLLVWSLTLLNFTCWPLSFHYLVNESWKVFLKFFRLQSVYKTSYWNLSELSYLWTFCLISLIVWTFSTNIRSCLTKPIQMF